MTADAQLLPRILLLQKNLFSSLRLKDVLDNAVLQLADLTEGAKVAVFLSDNDSLALKLMAAKGYSQATIDQTRVLSFTAETLLKQVVQKRTFAVARTALEAPDQSAAIMQREASQGQIALPLVASNLLVGAVLLDVTDAAVLGRAEVLRDVADLIALAVANAILFGRSEYERERLGTLYKTAVALGGSSLKVSEVLQITADTALVLGNTAHCAILMFDQNTQDFHVAAFKGLDGNSLSEFNLRMDDTIAGRCLISTKSEYVTDALRYQGMLPLSTTGANFGSVLAVPMYHDTDPIGVLMLFSTQMRGFHREQVDLLESLAQQASNALYIALTHESATAQSIQDAHTGLYNRWHFQDTFAKEIERCARHKRELSMLLIDIDHLSRINELLGTGKGDEAIRHVSKVIRSTLRDIDVPCRFGSEEFAVILPDTPAPNAYDVAERLRAAIRNDSAPGIGMITVSIGVASFPLNGDDGAAVMQSAEQALDIAKFEGRDRVKAAPHEQTPSGPIAWADLAKQAKLAVISERQSRLESRLSHEPEYAPWMKATAGWAKKKQDS